MSARGNLQIEPNAVPPAATTNRNSTVRTLKEPPEIWELVHETRADFKPGSALVGHLKALHPLALAVILLIIGGVAVFSFMKMRDWSASSTAAPNLQADSGIKKTDLSRQSTLPNKNESASDQQSNSEPAATDRPASTTEEPKIVVAAPAASTETAEIKIDETKVNVAAPAASSATKVVPKPRPQNPTSPATPTGEKVAARNKERTQASGMFANDSPTTARTDNKDAVQTSTTGAPKSEKEKAANPTATQKESDKALSPQLIAPAKTSSTPRPKVIAWP